MLTTLEMDLQIDGHTELHHNLQHVLCLLTLMRLVTPDTEFRIDTSLLLTACAAVVARNQAVLSLLPTFPRQPRPDDPARFARPLRTVLRWLNADMPFITVMLKVVESTQLHACLVAHGDLALPCPTFMEDTAREWRARPRIASACYVCKKCPRRLVRFLAVARGYMAMLHSEKTP